MAWEIRIYRDSRGRSPVEEFISALPEPDEARVRATVRYLQEVGNKAREPHSKHLEGNLFELRAKSTRIFYCFKPGEVIVLVHAFTKKSQKTPLAELEVAKKRVKEVEDD